MKGLIFTYLMTYGGAVAGLFNPFIGLLVYICFAILRPDWLWYWSVPLGNYSRIVAIGLLCGWALQGFGRWHFGRGRAVLAALGAYCAWASLAALLAPNQEVAWGFIETLAKIVLPILVGLTMIDSVARLKQVAWVILLSQGYLALEFNLSYLSGFNRVWVAGFAAMDNNFVAVGMDATIGLAFFIGLQARRWWEKAVAFGAAALMVHVVLFSMSRGGMLGLIVTGFVTFLLIPKRPVHLAFLILGVVVALRLAGPQVRERFASIFVDSAERDTSAQSRIELWKRCLQAMGDKPVFGVGPDHWVLVAPSYGMRRKEAHTLWLQTGAELGVPGMAALILFYGFCVARLWPIARGFQPVPDPWLRTAAQMVIAALAGFIVAAQFLSLENLEQPYYIAMIGVGVLKLASIGWPAPRFTLPFRPAPAPGALLACRPPS